MHANEAVVISLPERADRLDALLGSLPGDWPFPVPRLQPGIREQSPPWYRSSNGAWGCRQAHLAVLHSAWVRGVESTLVLEDDAVFAGGFTPAWQDLSKRIPRRWSMVMLGGEHITPPAPLCRGVVRCIETRRTHAYIIRLKAIPLLMNIWSRARRHIDHSNVEFQRLAAVYAPDPFLAGQSSGWSDIARKDNPHTRFWAQSV